MTLFVCQISIANHTDFIVTDPTLPTLSSIAVCDDNNDGYAVFDLTVQNAPILAAQSSAASNYSVSYYETLSNANANSNSIVNPNVYNNINISSQIIYFRVRNINTNAFVVGQFQIVVNVRPETTTILGNYVLCSSNSGYETFNLDTLILGILGGSSSGLNSVNFYTSQADAEAATNMITNPTSYVNQVIWTQTIYARVTTIATGCYGVVSFQIVVLPSPVISNLSGITVCDADSNPNNGTTAVDLTMQSSQIMAQQSSSASNYSVSYYTTQASAQQGTSPIIPATNYVGNDGQTIWVKVVNTATECFAISSFQLVINTPLLLITPTALNVCDDDANPNDQYHVFDLTVRNNVITQGLTGYTVTYYPSLFNAQNDSNIISTPTAYINFQPSVQTLGVRVTNAQTGCISITTLDIRVSQLPVAITPQPLHYCDSNNDGFGTFDLNSTINEIVGGSLSPGVGVSFYETASDAFIGAVYSLTSPYYNINTNTQTIYVRVYYALTGCSSYVQLQLIVDSIANPTLISNNTLNTVYVDGSNTVVQPLLLDCQLTGNYSYQWQVDGITIPNATSSTYLVDTATLNGVSRVFTVLVITLDTGCFSSTTITVEQSSGVPSPIGQTFQTFNPGDTLATLTVVGQNIQWYASGTNKNATSTPLPLNTVLVNGTTYYATQTIGGVESIGRLPVIVTLALGLPSNVEILLNFSPNPVDNVLTLQSNTILKLVLVYNLLGQKVIQQVVNDSNAAVDFSFLPTGNYMVKAQGESAQKVIKIVKQ